MRLRHVAVPAADLADSIPVARRRGDSRCTGQESRRSPARAISIARGRAIDAVEAAVGTVTGIAARRLLAVQFAALLYSCFVESHFAILLFSISQFSISLGAPR